MQNSNVRTKISLILNIKIVWMFRFSVSVSMRSRGIINDANDEFVTVIFWAAATSISTIFIRNKHYRNSAVFAFIVYFNKLTHHFKLFSHSDLILLKFNDTMIAFITNLYHSLLASFFIVFCSHSLIYSMVPVITSTFCYYNSKLLNLPNVMASITYN